MCRRCVSALCVGSKPSSAETRKKCPRPPARPLRRTMYTDPRKRHYIYIYIYIYIISPLYRGRRGRRARSSPTLARRCSAESCAATPQTACIILYCVVLYCTRIVLNHSHAQIHSQIQHNNIIYLPPKQPALYYISSDPPNSLHYFILYFIILHPY